MFKNLFSKNKHRAAEHRRKPLGQQLASWWRRQSQGIARLFRSRKQYPRPNRKSLGESFQQGFNKQLDNLIKGLVRAYRYVRGIRLRIPLWILVPIAFLLGGAATFAIMKQRRASSEVVLAVKGVTITSPEFLHRMEIQNGGQTLNAMVQEELTLQFAAKKGLLPSDAKVQERIKQMKLQPNFEDQVQQRHMTAEDIYRQARVQLASEALYTQNIQVTEQEAQDFYKANIDTTKPQSIFYIPEVAHLSVVTNTLEAEARKALQELRSGKSFAQVAKDHSLDRTRLDGGKMQAVLRGRTLFARDKDLETRIFTTPPGSIIGPLRFVDNWWIIRVDSVDPARTIPYEAVKENCMAAAKYIKATKMNQPALEKEFGDFRAKANIQVFWEKYFYDLTGQRK
jgi:parvulin-like peptidyl-prolyl isomerase